MSSRLNALRAYIQELDGAGVRRSEFYRLVAESLRATEGEPTAIRRAKVFAHILAQTPQIVHPHELLAGSILGLWPVVENLPAQPQRRAEALGVLEAYRARTYAPDYMPDKSTRWALMARDHYDGNIAFADLQQLIREMQQHYAGAGDINAVEIARELERHFVFRFPEEQELMKELPWIVANHLDLNYQKVVRCGLTGILESIGDGLVQATTDTQRTFYESTRIVIEAAIEFVRRYAATLDLVAAAEHDHTRSDELKEMAAVCRRIATDRPNTFREALQLIWLTHVMAHLGGGAALSFARFDQYLGPLYSRDVAEGRLTPEMAKDLVGSLWLKVNEPKMRTVQSLCLAGLRADGTDGANGLTCLCLEVCRAVQQPYPNTSVRINAQTPDWLWEDILTTIGSGCGHPMLLNDETMIANFVSLGFPEHDAVEYYNMGCVEYMLQGMMPNWGWGAGRGYIDFPEIIELVLSNGAENLAGRTGIPTGELDALETFDAFRHACVRQLQHMVAEVRQDAEKRLDDSERRYFDPYASALVDECLERGRDIFQGGARYYPPWPIGGFGFGTFVDSLSAVKTFVYDQQAVSLDELREALHTDFAERPDLQTLLRERTPRFGNDLPEVDELARELFNAYADAVHGLNDGSLPGKFVTMVFSYNRHVYAGEVTAATPDGRNARTVFSDAIGPSQGRDREGPTAMLNSILKLDMRKMTGAYALNCKLSPKLLQNPAERQAVKDLFKTYLRGGGVQLQVTCVDADVLRAAQARPEEHSDVIVRIAGYCEYFRNLSPELQDEIIVRTEYCYV